MDEYILFLDESNVTKHNPYLLLGGLVISRKEYKSKLIPNIQDCKTILGNPHIVFHYTDILKKQNDFSHMHGDEKMCTDFWNKLQTSLKDSDYRIFSSYTHAQKYNKEYPKGVCRDSYEVLFFTIINNYIHFLRKNNARGSIVFEAREETQNRKIQQYYFHMLQYGTNIYESKTIEELITTTSFIVKEENCIGLQIADIIANSCMKHVNGQNVKHNIWEILEPKLYAGNDNNTDAYGLVKLF